MILNSAKKHIDFRLSGIKLEFVDEYKHLGIMLSRKRLTKLTGRHVAQAVEKARTRANCIRHFGFRNDGLRPVTCISMYITLVRPILEYGAQALSYKSYSFKKSGKVKSIEEPPSYLLRLEKFQNCVLKTLIPCPKSTPPALVRLLTGIPTLNGRVDMLKLRFYWTSTTKNNSSRCDKLSTTILRQKRKYFLESNIGYIHEILNIVVNMTVLRYGMVFVNTKLTLSLKLSGL